MAGAGTELQSFPILSTLFKHVRRKDLLTCRSVCKEWNKLTIPFTRLEFVIIIHGHRDLHKSTLSSHCYQFNLGFNPQCSHHVEDFVQTFKRNKIGVPFSKYRLGPFPTRGGFGQEFLALCGDTIKGIHLFHDTYAIEDVSELLRFTPNLEALGIPYSFGSGCTDIVKLFPSDGPAPKLSALKNLNIFHANPDKRLKFYHTLLEELLAAAESIACLSLWGPFSGSGSIDNCSLEVLRVIEKLGREAMIQELRISGVRNKHLEILRTMAKKPNGLKLKMLYCYTIGNCPIPIITLFKDTLRYLEVGSEFTSLDEFPNIPHLIRLSFYVANDFNSRCSSMKGKFPVLKQLQLLPTGQALDEFFPDIPTIESLYLELLEVKLSAFTRILTVIPKLNEFRLTVETDGVVILRQIWTRLTELKSLWVTGYVPVTTESLDSVLTGIPTQIIQENPDMLMDVDKMTAELRLETVLKLRNQYSVLPCIANLTNLRYLELNLTVAEIDGTRVPCLTDLSGYIGLYSMQHLSNLIVYRSKFSETCREIMSLDMDLDRCNFD